jgi:hypothetical protein
LLVLWRFTTELYDLRLLNEAGDAQDC